jgi:hypothetical protein
MKNIVSVSGMKDVPDKLKRITYVVNVNSWEEAILFLSGKKGDVVMFWGADVPVERLLKAVESFEGNLLVYSEAEVNATMRSRFTRVLRGKQTVKWRAMSQTSKLGELVNQVKVSMGVA